MALLSVLYLGILATAHGALEPSWEPRLARYAGYDLERGPVFYEAYYPEDQSSNESPPNAYQEKRFFDRPEVMERSYQVPEGPYDLPFNPSDTPRQPQRIDYVQPSLVPFSTFGSDDLQSKENSPQPNRGFYPFREQPANDLQAQGSRLYVTGERDNQPSQEFIFGEPPLVQPSEIRVWSEPFSNGNEQELDVETQGLEAARPMFVENIFEPRPQIVKYVFSAPKEIKAPEHRESEAEAVTMNWPRKYGDNILQEEIRMEDERELKKDEKEAEVASIQVSEVPRHKIRHHHGERQKRAFIRH